MLRAWIIWFLSALFMCFKNAIEVSPSIMAPELMREFSLTGAEMGNFAAFYFYAYLILQIPAGLLIDKWARGKSPRSRSLSAPSASFSFQEQKVIRWPAPDVF